MTLPRSLLAVLPLFALTACGPAVPPYTVNVPPRLDDIRPPRSIVFVRDDLPLTGLQKAIDGALGDTLASTKKAHIFGRDVEIAWRFDRKPVVFRAERAGLVLEVPLVGNIGVHADSVRCRDEDAAIVLRAEAQPALKPNGNIGFDHFDWKPKVRAELKCAGLPLPVDKAVSFVVDPIARALSLGLSKIELPTGPLVEKALDELRAPRKMPFAKRQEACLDLAPDALVLSPVTGGGSAMPLKLGVEVAPRVVVGKCPPSGAAAKQPKVVAKNVPLGDHFELQTAFAIPYLELTKMVRPSLVGKRFGDADHGVVVDTVEIGDTQGRTLVHLTVHGALDGDLYLWGTPTMVEEKGRVIMRIPDLKVAAESRSILQNIGLALWSAVGGGLEGALKDKLHMDMTAEIEDAKKAMTGSHALLPGAQKPALVTNLTRIHAKDATSKPGVMVLWPVLAGTAELAVQ